jgi:hypothetical protein
MPITIWPWTASGRAGENQRADRVQAVLQRGHHAEVAAAAPQPPEQVGVLVLAGGDELAIGGDHVGRQQVVAGQAALAQQPADPAAEGEAGDAGAGHQAAGDGQAERLGLVVELRPRDPGLGGSPPAGRIDPDALHWRGVDDDPAVGGGKPSDAVGAAADRHLESFAAGELHRPNDVGGASAADDQRRPPVVRGIPHRAGLLVVGVGRSYQLTPEGGFQFAEGSLADDVAIADRVGHGCLPLLDASWSP